MSMLGEQIKELREKADAMHRRSREIGLDYGMGRGLADASRMLREAADTIEGLRDRLQELQGVYGESRYSELFGTPERAARTLVDSCNDDYDYGCGGCPVGPANCKCGDYDAILEWMRGDA